MAPLRTSYGRRKTIPDRVLGKNGRNLTKSPRPRRAFPDTAVHERVHVHQQHVALHGPGGPARGAERLVDPCGVAITAELRLSTPDEETERAAADICGSSGCPLRLRVGRKLTERGHVRFGGRTPVRSLGALRACTPHRLSNGNREAYADDRARVFGAYAAARHFWVPRHRSQHLRCVFDVCRGCAGRVLCVSHEGCLPSTPVEE